MQTLHGDHAGGAWSAHGLTLGPDADAGLAASAHGLEAHDLRWQLGGLTLRVARMQLEAFTARFSRPAGNPLPRLQHAEIGRLQLMGVELDDTELPPAAAPSDTPWRLDALAGLQGMVHAFVTDAVWAVDAEVRLALRDGRIDFNRVSVEHIGPDSSMGISRGGVYVDVPQLGREFLYLFTAREIPGARFEARGAGWGRRVTDRGAIDLRAFVAGLLAQQPFAWPGKLADRHVSATFDRTRMTGELQLGDGALGSERQHLVLSGQADGKNRVIVSAAMLSHKLVVRLPDMAAAGARFEGAGLAGRSGAVSADLSLRVTGLGNGAPGARPKLALSLGHLSVEQLRLQAPEFSGSSH